MLESNPRIIEEAGVLQLEAQRAKPTLPRTKALSQRLAEKAAVKRVKINQLVARSYGLRRKEK